MSGSIVKFRLWGCVSFFFGHRESTLLLINNTRQIKINTHKLENILNDCQLNRFSEYLFDFFPLSLSICLSCSRFHSGRLVLWIRIFHALFSWHPNHSTHRKFRVRASFHVSVCAFNNIFECLIPNLRKTWRPEKKLIYLNFIFFSRPLSSHFFEWNIFFTVLLNID